MSVPFHGSGTFLHGGFQGNPLDPTSSFGGEETAGLKSTVLIYGS